MEYKTNKNGRLWWVILAVAVIWLALLMASCMGLGVSFSDWLYSFNDRLKTPYVIEFNAYSLKVVGVFLLLYGFAVTAYLSTREPTRRGEEYGSAKWGGAKQINAKYRNHKNADANFILTQNVSIGMDSFRHKKNLNILVVGGSGSGKSRGFSMPGAMNCDCDCSFLITDPKGEAARALTPMFQSKGIPVAILDLVDLSLSDGFNPFVYIQTDLDALRLVSNLIKNTTPKGASQNDPFWERAETALLSAIILYLKHEARPEEQNFSMVMYLIENCGADENDDEHRSPMDIIFEMLEEQNPTHIALRQYKVFKQATGKTAMSILVSAAVRLSAFNLSELARMTDHDDMDFGSLGERQRVIFCIIPDSESTLSYLVGMLYTCAFIELYRVADKKYGGMLPVHVRFVLDEFPNTPLPEDYLKILSTCRSRNISQSIIIQNIAQLKGLFKDEWESLVGNTASILYLGGNEASTHEYFSKQLGKSSIGTQTRGVTKGRNGSSSKNFQGIGRELLTPDEVRALDNRYALLLIQGEPPVIDLKYDITKHRNYSLTALGGATPYVRQLPVPEFRNDLSGEIPSEDIEIIE